jgi:hypothetical protein
MENYSFTMRSKPIDFIENNLTYKDSPGPGSHKDFDLRPKGGRFSLSKFSDSLFSVIHPKT